MGKGKKGSTGEITPQQERFCREYVVDLHGTNAAIRAGYEEKAAASQASRLLRKSNIIECIQKLMTERNKRTDINADSVLKELARIAFANLADVASWYGDRLTVKDSESLTDDQKASILEVSQTFSPTGGATLSIKQHSKVKALELLGKHLKLFTDKMEHSAGMTLEQLLVGMGMTEDKEGKKE